ncbi:MAG TPA: tetratricopeptide repeat protein [Candidatus Methylacidiphilales bacterium]|nr:tetratricopeptide repeat protein [Candidatus Methylacidiphilales bacterium]
MLIFGACLALYAPVLHGGWLWDDAENIIQNPLVGDPVRLWKIWFVPGSLNEYYPLEQTFLWALWHLGGGQPLAFHLANVLLHGASSLLVWLLLAKLQLRHAWLGGLLFAIHPLQVESVAWISELKNTLSLPPLLIAMCLWIDYEDQGKPRPYWLALASFTVALLCKVSVIALPPVLLLYAWWKRGTLSRRDLAVTWPFFAVALVLGAINYHVASTFPVTDEIQDLHVTLGLAGKLLLISSAFAFYFAKFFWPVALSPIYPHWSVESPAPWQFLGLPLLLLLIGWGWATRARMGRHLLLGLGFTVFNLGIILEFICGNYSTMVWSLDHLVYIPVIGIIGLVVAGIDYASSHLQRTMKRVLGAGLALLFVLLALTSFQFAGKFIDQRTLWTHALRCYPDLWFARLNLATSLLHDGDTAGAISEFRRTLQLNPDSWLAHQNLAAALSTEKDTAGAISEYQRAVQINPDFAGLYINLGTALQAAGRGPEAIAALEQAVRLKPDNELAHLHLGSALVQAGRASEAIPQEREAIRLKPDDAQAHCDLGAALETAGQLPDAIAEFQRALQQDPTLAEARDNLLTAQSQTGATGAGLQELAAAAASPTATAVAHDNYGSALYQAGRGPEAIAQFQQAIARNPDDAKAHLNLGLVFMQTGRLPEAVTEFRAAIRLQPGNAAAHSSLGCALGQMGQSADAIDQFQQALQVTPDNPDIRYNFAVTLFQAGHLKEAKTQFEQLLKLNPGDDSSRDYLKQINARPQGTPAGK